MPEEDQKQLLSVVRLEDDPEHMKLVEKVDTLDSQVRALLDAHKMIEQSSYRIERALFGGWSDTGQRTDGFITNMNQKLEQVNDKATQAIALAKATQGTFDAIKRGVWAIFVTVLASLLPAAINIYMSLHPTVVHTVVNTVHH